MSKLPVPTRRQVHAAGERSMLAAVLFAAAATVVSRGGYAGQVWPYAVMAVAVLPQGLLALVARFDRGRHVDIRVSRRPIWPNGVVGVVLAGAALVLVARHGAGSAEGWSAALGAAAGLLSAVPPVLVQPRARTRQREADDARDEVSTTTPQLSGAAGSGSPQA
jgi:hypothetical protein